jgi:hypothetical protein
VSIQYQHWYNQNHFEDQGSKKETEMSSFEAPEEVDVDNGVGDVSPVDALVSEKVIECTDNTGRQSKAGPGSAVFDLEYAVNMYAECIPYPAIGDEVVLDEEYNCKEPEIAKMAQSLVISKWPEMRAVFS